MSSPSGRALDKPIELTSSPAAEEQAETLQNYADEVVILPTKDRLSQWHVYRQAGIQRASKQLGLGLSLRCHRRADEQSLGGMARRPAAKRSL